MDRTINSDEQHGLISVVPTGVALGTHPEHSRQEDLAVGHHKDGHSQPLHVSMWQRQRTQRGVSRGHSATAQ